MSPLNTRYSLLFFTFLSIYDQYLFTQHQSSIGLQLHRYHTCFSDISDCKYLQIIKKYNRFEDDRGVGM